MMRLVIWAWSTCWISCMTGSSGLTWLHRQRSMLGSVAHVLLSKAGSQKPPQKHHGHASSRAGPPWLPVSGTWEGPGRECSSSHRSLHQVCPGICHQDPDHSNDCQNPMGQVHCPLQVAQKDPHRSSMKLQKLVGGWPLWVDGDTESADQSVPSANQWPVWKIQFHPDQYAWDLTQGKEVRVEESHWNVGSCIQLHPEFSYVVQPLLSHVWQTTSSSHWCHAWFGPMHNHRAKHVQVCSENQEAHLVGSEKGWGISDQRSATTQMKLW